MRGRDRGAGVDVTVARRTRTVSAWVFAAAAVAAGVLVARTASGAGVFLGVDQVVARPTAALGPVGGLLPLGYAFAAGMLAAANPCGFALLPGYLGLYLGSLEAPPSPARPLGRAPAGAGAVGAAVVVAFGPAARPPPRARAAPCPAWPAPGPR